MIAQQMHGLPDNEDMAGMARSWGILEAAKKVSKMSKLGLNQSKVAIKRAIDKRVKQDNDGFYKGCFNRS